MSDQSSESKESPKTRDRRVLTEHTVVRFTVTRAAAPCPVFHPRDVFYVRQHVLDTEISSIRNFCSHTLFDLYPVYERVRKGPVGGKETFACRDKKMVGFEVERLPDEKALIGRAEVAAPDRCRSREASPGAQDPAP